MRDKSSEILENTSAQIIHLFIYIFNIIIDPNALPTQTNLNEFHSCQPEMFKEKKK